MSWTLGIGGYFHDASVALFEEGRLVAAVQEERLTRVKHAGGLPYDGIRYCLDTAGIKPADVETIAFYLTRFSNDYVVLDAMKKSFTRLPEALANSGQLVRNLRYKINKSMSFRGDMANCFFHKTGFEPDQIQYYSHHLCHAGSSFYASPFDEAAILCVDWEGDGDSVTIWKGEGTRMTKVLGLAYPQSISMLYSRVTQFLGFSSWGDEYKVMGLSAYGKPKHVDKLKRILRFTDEGYELDLDYFKFYHGYFLSEKFTEEFGPARKPNEDVGEYYADMAASVQALYEETLVHLAKIAKRLTGCNKITLAGGSALNCKGNGVLLLEELFDEIFIPPGASDLGTSMGAALYHIHQVQGKPREFTETTDSWGPEFSDDDILEELERSGVNYVKLEDPPRKAAELIADGDILGWFQGRMEFGPRSLGYRSIIADPRSPEVKERINRTIKYREEFRPFAPSCLREKSQEFFGIDIDSPFMTFTVKVPEEKRKDIAGVVHVDGSARIQTVSKEHHPLYHQLISNFEEITGVPVVLNTSFNLAGEAIVCRPIDAIRTLFTCGMNALIIGSYLIHKKDLNRN